MKSNIIDRKLLFIFYISFIFFHLFCTIDEEVLITYISFDSIKYMFVLLNLLVLFLVCFRKKIRIYRVNLCNIILLIIGVISICFNEEYIVIGRLIYFIASLLVFLFFSNISLRKKEFEIFLSFIIIIVFLQTVAAYYSLNFFGLDSFTLINWYKYFLRIPLGASNAISATIVPILAYFIMKNKQKKIDYILTIISIFTILLTRSDAGYILIFLLFIVKLYTKSNNIIKKILIVLGFVFIVTGILYFLINRDKFLLLDNGRLEIYYKYINYFLSNPILGVAPQTIEIGAHNILLDFLGTYGVFSLIIYLYILIELFNKGKYYFNDPFKKSIFVSLIFYFFNSLFEINYFNFWGEVFFFMLAGILYNKIIDSNYMTNNFLIDKG